MSSIVQQNIQFSPVCSMLQVIRRVSTNICIAYGRESTVYRKNENTKTGLKSMKQNNRKTDPSDKVMLKTDQVHYLCGLYT